MSLQYVLIEGMENRDEVRQANVDVLNLNTRNSPIHKEKQKSMINYKQTLRRLSEGYHALLVPTHSKRTSTPRTSTDGQGDIREAKYYNEEET